MVSNKITVIYYSVGASFDCTITQAVFFYGIWYFCVAFDCFPEVAK